MYADDGDVGFTDTGKVMDLMAYDGRPFAHLHENLRDSLLNGATKVVFGAIGLEDLSSDPSPRVAKRVMYDDGNGMSDKTYRDVYFKLSATDTNNTFLVEFDHVTGKVHVTTKPVTGKIDPRHARRGVGGRVSLSNWNPLGIVTINIHDGNALMAQMFRSVDGKPKMRLWYDEDGKRHNAVAPYRERPKLTYDDILADRTYARRLLFAADIPEVSGDIAAVENTLDRMDETKTLPNPFKGYDWASIVPEWIGVYNPEDGRWYRKDDDGSIVPAHGVIKILLGEKVTDSTALTGDPAYPSEGVASRYNGAITDSWLDLSAWDVRVWAIQPETAADRKGATKKEHVWFSLVGHTGKFRLDGGQPNNKSEPTGRRQLGSMAYRTKDPDNVLHTEIVELGKYGSAYVVVNDPKKPGASFGATSRHGTVAFVYNNELHGISDSDKLTPSDYQYRNMGIPTLSQIEVEREVKGKKVKVKVDLYEFVSIYIFAPFASETHDGIYQRLARDSLKWSGGDKLPLGGDDGINAAIRDGLSAEFLALFDEADSEGGVETSVPDTRYQHLSKLARETASSPRAGGRTRSSDAARTDDPALIHDGKADNIHPGNPVKEQGKPGPEGRPDVVCDLGCTGKFHEPDCPHRGTGGGPGGGSGPFTLLEPDDEGPIKGRESKAKLPGGEDEPDKPEVILLPPRVQFKEKPIAKNDDGDPEPMWPVTWEPKAHDLKPDEEGRTTTGTIYVYRDHLAIQECFTIGAKAKKDPTDTESAVIGFIQLRLSDALMGSLALAETNLNQNKGKRPVSAHSLTAIKEWLVKNEWWFVTVASLSADEMVIKRWVADRATARRRKAPVRKATAKS